LAFNRQPTPAWVRMRGHEDLLGPDAADNFAIEWVGLIALRASFNESTCGRLATLESVARLAALRARGFASGRALRGYAPEPQLEPTR
jgi:hypothetical protein